VKQYVPTLLLFGGSGFIGSNLGAVALQRGWRVFIADTSYHPGLAEAEWRQVDITEAEAVERVLADVSPDAAVNLAAMADIDRADREKELTWQINVNGAAYIAAVCAQRKIRQLFFSSDAVFDGNGGPYREDDTPNPVNYYGISKAAAEAEVLEANPQAVLVRVSLVLGFPVTEGNSYLAALDQKLRAGEAILCPEDEIRTPVDVKTLCESVLELAGGSFEGVLHIGCLESVDRYELTRRAAQEMGYSMELVRPQETVIGSTSRAARHKNGILDVSRAQTVLTTPMLNLDQTIKRAVSGRNRSA
jgi:dTDP-4-dehydrorhamnose reductase